jgi:hypothetical protein
METTQKALDVKGKIVVVQVDGKDLEPGIQATLCSPFIEAGAIEVFFINKMVKINAFSDDELNAIGLQRMPNKKGKKK